MFYRQHKLPYHEGQYLYRLEGIVGVNWLIIFNGNSFEYYMQGESQGLSYGKGKTVVNNDTVILKYSYITREKEMLDTLIYDGNKDLFYKYSQNGIYKNIAFSYLKKEDSFSNLYLKYWKAKAKGKWKRAYKIRTKLKQ